MRVLFAGETYFVHETHMKGVDYFLQNRYQDDSGWLRGALEAGGIEVDHIPSHMVPEGFPNAVEALKRYDAVILSDVGANSLLLCYDTMAKSIIMPNRLNLLEQFVREGGGLLMVGGYMSFSGIEGRAFFRGTAIETLLPVEMVPGDDRREVPEGAQIAIERPEHPIFDGIPAKWPKFLGYNRLIAKPGTQLASHDGNAFIAAWDYGMGRSAAFASDCAPHWGPEAFVRWEFYGKFWCNVIRYLAKK
ncbi:MAG: cytoplasmic protein [Clostridiales bacterium]|jgi:uncharacterized membrane protein|nr:cytoplasmic protein [Clostridiales bacterium]OPZ69654.1 MAG: hypothetical protein BWY81_00329 [Firmicutes bacterium ADurb.Bin467]